MNKSKKFYKSKLAIMITMVSASYVNAQSTNIEEIEVIGSRAALMSALDRQRNSDKVVGVIDSDAIGDFADINVSESLRRISGIMVENDQGEGRYVSVRGMNSDLNSMTINGVSTVSPEDRRGIMLDGVPTDMLDSMTVYKTLTPNLDADTIGGAIDLETISAFSYDDMHVRIKVETSYNDLTKDGSNPTLSARFTNRFELGDGELGAALILSDQTRHIVAHNNENGGWSDDAPNDDYEMRFYDLERDREGVVLNLDYLTADGQKYYAHIFRNEYTDTEYRGKWETKDGLEDNTASINGSTYTYADTRMDSEARFRTEIREVNAYQVGGDFEFNNGNTLLVEFFASEAEQDDGDRLEANFRSSTIGTPVTYNSADPRRPIVSYDTSFYNPATFEFDAFEDEVSLTTDEDTGIKVDMTYALNLATELQYGFKYRQREKRNDSNLCIYEPVGTSTLADYDSMTINPYLNSVHGPSPTIGTIRGFKSMLGSGNVALADGTFCQSAGTFFEFSGDEDEESIPADWQTEEDVLALYLMGTTQLDRASMIYGIRYEDTESTYTGKIFDDTGFGGTTVTNKDYDFWAPSFNLRYEIDDQQLARVGIFRSLVRPGFKESRASSIRDIADNEIEGGNPNLEPTTAWNFDFTYEYYMNENTFFGAGLFYKSIEDAIIEVESEDLLLYGNVWDEASTFLNTEDSSILGFEFSVQTVWDNGMLMVFNYTHADGESDLPADSTFGQRTIPYFKQAEDTANFVLGYDKNGLDLRLAFNYRSEYLDEIGGSSLEDRYTSDHMQIDLTAKYKINDNLQITAAAINLNDRPEYYYFGNSTRLSQYDEYGTTYTLGLRYTF